MAYRINKTDGSILTDLIDGVVDTSTTDLALIGRNYSGFGEVLNENFVKLLENFSSTSAPENALRGQLWYDVAENRLKVYNGETFVSASGNIVGNVASNVDTGDIFVDTSVDQLKFYNGSTFVTVGPTYTSSQGKTGVEGIDIVDTVGVQHTVLGQYIAGVLRGIWSTVNTTPNAATTPAGWTAGNALQIGFNPVDAVNYKYRAAASSTDSLNDALGNSYIADDFVKVEERDSLNNLVDQRIESGLFVKSTSGLTVGYQDARYATLKVEPVGPISVLDVERQDNDFAIRITEGTAKVNAIKIDSSERYIGIFNNTPTATLDVTGTVKATEFIGDFKGTIVADDSTILVDAVNGIIPSANLSGALPAIDGSALTGINAVATFVDLNDTSVGGQATDTLIRFDGANYVPTTLTEDASGNITVTGNLTVQGTTTQVDSNIVNIGDSIITLNSDETGAPTQNAGIEVERGTSTNVQLRWNESNDKWEVTEDGVAYSDILTAAIEGIKTSGNLRFNDNVKATFGTSNDLEILHNGTNTIFNNSTGTLTFNNFQDDGAIVFNTDDGAGGTTNYIRMTGSTGEVLLYHYGSEKLATKSTGVEVTGNLVVSGQIETSTIDTADSSALTVTPSTIFSSDVTVENVLYLNNPPDFGVPINLPSGSTLGGVPIGTTEGGGDADTLNGQPGSYYLDGANFTGSLPNDYVTLGTDTTGNYVATISGTANEVEVTGSGSETAAVTIGLPNDVTIGNELTVTTGLFTPLIDTADSSALTITPAAIFSSDVTVENDLVVTNKITATEFVGVTYANLDDVDITGRTNNSLTKFDGANYVPTLLKEFSDGDLRPAKDIEMLDNQYIVLGSNRDLWLFSDGTTGIIQSPIEPLKIRVPATGTSPTADGLLLQSTTNETLASFLPNYGVYLYHNDVLKLETTSDGIIVYGDVTQDGASTLSYSTLSTSTIDSLDSSAVTIVPAAVFNSDVTVENDLVVTNKVTATETAKKLFPVPAGPSDITISFSLSAFI